jgi:protein AFG1
VLIDCLGSHELRKSGVSGNQFIDCIAGELGKRHRLICLDEFQVVDIADAMILKGLLEALFKHQVTLLITSNRPPDDLYLNGIQRASFLPCIELIKDRLDVLHMNGLQDYRLRSTPTTATGQYYSVGDMSSLDGLFKELSRNQTVGQLSIPVMGRTITVKRCIGDAAWFDFDDLFRAPLSAVDYLALADIFLTIFIVNVPAFYSSDLRTEARRFVTFIDVLYDKKGRLAVQAQVPLDQLFRLPGQNSSSVEELELADVLNVNRGAALFTGAEEQFAVARAYSRIHQMTSLVWWNDSQRDATAPGP